MKNMKVLFGVCLVVLILDCNVQAHPHRSIEDTEEDSSSSESDPSISPVVPPVHAAHDRESSNVREMTSPEMTSHEKSHENDSEDEDKNTSASVTSQDSEPNSDEDDAVKFPKTEQLCPARPEEITNIELECVKEYQQWKELKAKKEMTLTTTCEPTVEPVETLAKSDPMSEDMKMSTTQEPTSDDVTVAVTTEATLTTTVTMAATDGEGETTTETADVTTEMAATSSTTTAMMAEEMEENKAGRKRKRSTIKRKRSCYPATCILKKLKLLDSMGQLNSKQVQKFAVNMTVDGTTNLEQKAMECVKEINDSMRDNSSDMGRKVGCVAQKVINCLNKGLACPIVKVQH